MTIGISLPNFWSSVYLNIARGFQFSLRKLGYRVLIYEQGIQSNEIDWEVILGWQLRNTNDIFHKPYVIYQLEPLALPLWQEKLRLHKTLFDGALSIWDYSISNLPFYQNRPNTKHLPIGYVPELNSKSRKDWADYDVLFVGFGTERRVKIIEQLQQKCSVSIQPRWGKDFENALNRSKILLNIHQYDFPTPLEQVRVSYALNQECFVLSEESADKPYNSLPTCQYNNIVETVLYFLNTPNKRESTRNKSVNEFKDIKMVNTLDSILKLLAEKYSID